MNLSTHIAVGATVGYFSQNPVLGFFAGILSHHLLDQIPHTDGGSLNVDVQNFAKDKRIIAIVFADLVLISSITYYIFLAKGFSLPIIFGAFGAALPDLIDNMPFWSPAIRKTKLGNYYHRFHEFFHYTIENKVVFWTGIINQFILIAISLKLLI